MGNNFALPVSESGAQPVLLKKSRPLRILLVDDDEDIRHTLNDVLTRAGCAVDTARNGAIAWDSLEHSSYDLLITDNDMPIVSGVELIAKLKNAHMKLPVIMVTTAIPDQEFTKRPWLMPNAVILKPVIADELLGTVKTVLCA